MPFDLRIDFSTNDLQLDTRDDIQIIEQQNLAYQQIHNRLLIARGTYIHDLQLGSNFDGISREVNTDYEASVETMVTDALADIEDIEIISVQTEKRPVGFDPKTYRPRRARKVNTIGDFTGDITGVVAGVSNDLIYDTQIYRGDIPGACRGVYTGQPAVPPHAGHPSNLGYISASFPISQPSTACVWVWIPSSWDGGNSDGSGVRLSVEGFGGAHPDQENALAVSPPADPAIVDTFQPLRVEFTPPNQLNAAIVLRGWNHETTPADAPSVGSWLVHDDWEFYNVTWPEYPDTPGSELSVSIEFAIRYDPDYADGEAEFPGDIRTTSFTL